MRRFVETADAVASTTKKTEKVRLVADLFRLLERNDAAQAAIFLTGRAFPRREERVLGVGGSSLYRLVAELTGRNAEELGNAYRKHGDMGDVAGELLAELHANRDVPAAEVAAAFEQLPSARSQTSKYALLKELFEKAGAGDVKYI